MDGQRVERTGRRRHNPLYLIFLGLCAAVAVLLIVTIVLAVKLSGANKDLKASGEQVELLTKAMKDAGVAMPDDSGAFNTGSNVTGPKLPETTTPSAGSTTDVPAVGTDVLAGHSELQVKPAALLSANKTYYIATSSGLNMRAGPAATYTLITVAAAGDKVEAVAQEGEWTLISYQGKYGWVKTEYLSTTQPNFTPAKRAEATGGNLKKH